MLLILPILIPLLTAALMLCLWRFVRMQRWLSVTSMAAQLAVAVALLLTVIDGGIIAVQMGNWPAPFGITLVADLLSAIMVLLAAGKGMAVAVYALVDIRPQHERFGFYPLFQLLIMGVCGAFLTGDMFNLYVCFEIMLMSSFVLLCLGCERGQIEGAIKYVTLNLISSAIFLAAVGILYGLVGTLNMADIALKLAEMDNPLLTTVLAMMFLVAFGIKAGAFPLFFWLPASYHTPPVAISAIFAGLLTKVGVYALVRVFTLVFVNDIAFTHTVLLVGAGLTMLVGVLGAAVQTQIRRILSFHIISQIGYMIMGLGLAGVVLVWSDAENARDIARLALAGSVFYIMHHIVVKTNLFLVSGVVERLQGSGALDRVGGFYRSWPMLSVLFLIPALSLAGIPPLSGFWAKFALVKAGLQGEQYLIVVVAVLVGLVTLFSMTKIWAAVFWSPAPPDSPMGQQSDAYLEASRGVGYMIAPIAVLAAVTVAIGLAAGPLFGIALDAADQLLDPAQYIEVVGPVRTAIVAEEASP